MSERKVRETRLFGVNVPTFAAILLYVAAATPLHIRATLWLWEIETRASAYGRPTMLSCLPVPVLSVVLGAIAIHYRDRLGPVDGRSLGRFVILYGLLLGVAAALRTAAAST